MPKVQLTYHFKVELFFFNFYKTNRIKNLQAQWEFEEALTSKNNSSNFDS